MAGIVRRQRFYFSSKELSLSQPKKLQPALWIIPDMTASYKASLTEYFEDLGMDPWARKPQTNTHVQKQKKKSVNKRLKYGHFGTLDPFATGLLPIGFGHGTKFGDLLPLQTKTYSARLQLGVATDSDDLKGKEIERGPSDWKMPSAEVVQALCEEHFLGDILQTPPMYSAIRVDGERAYKKARRGEEVKMKPRKAFVHDITSRIISPTVIEFDVTAAAGLYVRTVGSDLARKLGTCGHLIGLRRTAMGAVRLDSFGSNKALLMDLFDLFGQFPRVRSKYDLQTTCTRLAQSVSVAKMLDKRDTNLKPGTFATIYADDVPLCLIEFHPHGHSKIKLNFVPSTLLEMP
ncbi:tRNA pseudouridine synthase B [Hondaea fermentalgiana]|uniref:tRNA pseudouridine(55) synthase n=1 Tax=Hondaea fermentalgiana TaxID=2315210 RepID=A0A2R5GAY7_9STRA|nr:tRNA pseudouridine synthase B [Hondaea fermentalgiana]|eukprot:GBG28182.1 tRNA pseudouridine synthase B [Hondaea fermentalgiana]